MASFQKVNKAVGAGNIPAPTKPVPLRIADDLRHAENTAANPPKPNPKITMTPPKCIKALEVVRDGGMKLRLFVWDSLTSDAYLIREQQKGQYVVLAGISFGGGKFEARREQMSWMRRMLPGMIAELEEALDKEGL